MFNLINDKGTVTWEAEMRERNIRNFVGKASDIYGVKIKKEAIGSCFRTRTNLFIKMNSIWYLVTRFILPNNSKNVDDQFKF